MTVDNPNSRSPDGTAGAGTSSIVAPVVRLPSGALEI